MAQIFERVVASAAAVVGATTGVLSSRGTKRVQSATSTPWGDVEDPSERRLSRDRYQHGVEVFLRFAGGSKQARLWERLAQAAERDVDLPAGDVCDPRERLSHSFEALVAALLRCGRERAACEDLAPLAGQARAERLARELATHADGLAVDDRRALDVLLARALDPVAGLLTFAPEDFFEARELAWLRAHPPARAAARRPGFTWRPGHDVDYGGYVCVIAKFTRLCNLRCVYCADWRSGPGQSMSFDVQARLFETLLGSPAHAVVDLIWHGGEPTLLGVRGFLRVLYLQAWFLAAGQRLHNVIQTNAAVIDERWARLLAHFGFRAGVSLDGPAELHDDSRPDVRGRSTFEATGRGIELLRRHGVLGNVLLVVSERTLAWGAEPLVRFLQERGLTRTSLLAVRPDLRLEPGAGSYLQPERYAAFLVEFDRARRARPEPWIAVREIDALVEALRGRPSGHCETAGQCVGAFFSLDPDGAVRHCDKFGNVPDYHLGNLLESDFDQIRAAARTQALAARAQAETTAFESCPYFHYCRGWCPHERFVARVHGCAADAACCGLSPLFDGLQTNLLADAGIKGTRA